MKEKSVKILFRFINFLRFLITNSYSMDMGKGKCEIYGAFNNAFSQVMLFLILMALALFDFSVFEQGKVL